LGFNLGIAPATFQHNGLHYLVIPALTAFLQYYQLKVATPAPKKVEEDPKALKKLEDKDGKKPEPSFQEVFQKQSKFMFPLMVGYFSYILPVGLALYWNVFSLFSILQAKEKIWKKK
jgi:YidC/Oxa1 family membrane protein insertase